MKETKTLALVKSKRSKVKIIRHPMDSVLTGKIGDCEIRHYIYFTVILRAPLKLEFYIFS